VLANAVSVLEFQERREIFRSMKAGDGQRLKDASRAQVYARLTMMPPLSKQCPVLSSAFNDACGLFLLWRRKIEAAQLPPLSLAGHPPRCSCDAA
jgi:hypothetical protein